MKQSIKLLLGGAFLLSLPMVLTSCQDILGEWDKPAPVNVTPSTDDDGGGTATGETYRVYTSGTDYTDEVIPDGATKLTGTIAATVITEGTYVISGTVTCTGDISLSGDVNLILEDDADFTITGTILGLSSKLNVYGQTNGTGKIKVASTGDVMSVAVKDMEVHGGTVTTTANGGDNCFETTGSLTIYKGDISATNTGTSNGMMLTTLKYYGGYVEAMGGTGGNGISQYSGTGDYIFNYYGVTIPTITYNGTWSNGPYIANNAGISCTTRGISFPSSIL